MTHVDLIEKLLKYVLFLRITDLHPPNGYADRVGILTMLIDTILRNETRGRRQWLMVSYTTRAQASVIWKCIMSDCIHGVGKGAGGSWA